ncbi:hypothetical protein C2G38_2176019 [Gigaspora rosea]|uniref:Uncharacterized protein n=1 Tax=Gigaspora rosea TaxID=44941 RepID=A0A397VR68_9GLOM|nr:hypothetical protein C2G38_2176019 [Gigaspora rosea]
MEDLELIAPYDDIILPNAWEIENKVNYTDPDDNKAIIIHANNPIPLECGYFTLKLKMIGVGYCTKQNNKEIGDSYVKSNYIPVYDMLMPGQGYKENDVGCSYHVTMDIHFVLEW